MKAAPSVAESEPAYYDLGHHTRLVSTSSADAQAWFDRGLIWTYGFNHEEAVRCFRKAVEADPELAIGYWGIAYASGPNYNKAWEDFDPEELGECLATAFEAARKATDLKGGASDAEAALIDALIPRYATAEPPIDSAGWNLEYANAMRDAARRFPDDLDIATLTADALMILTPWDLWDQSTGEPAEGAATLEAKEILDHGLSLKQGMQHPGLLHLYLHLMEMSPFPERALPAADALRDLVPEAGHLRHMPSHIDVLVGDYSRANDANSKAMVVDEIYREREGDSDFYALYRAHNIHFRVYGAMFSGQSGLAIESARALEQILPEEVLRLESPPMADWLEGFLTTRVHALVRFGRWQELIDEPLPADPDLYCATTAMIHYGKGVAHAASGHVSAAERQQELFVAAKQMVPESRMIFNNTCVDILGVAQQMLAGEISYRQGKFDDAFASLERSIALDDGLPYDEPWGWMQPTRHAYGALLLEQGEVERAEKIYRADLGLDGTLARACQHPNNVWSLSGLYECLVKTGKTHEAAIIKRQLDLASARADVPIEASCFCRGAHVP